MVTRREFNRSLLATVVSYSLLQTIFETAAYSRPIEPVMERWLRGLHEMCGDLRTHELTPLQWQEAIEALHAKIELPRLLEFIDFERLISDVAYPRDRGAIRNIDFPRLEGLPERRGFGSKIFAYRKGAATAPHAHNNMVSAHLILKGEFHVRTYGRVRDEREHLILTPSVDGQRLAGKTITMSDERDNVHWFLATSDHAYTFDVPVVNLFPDKHYATPANRYGMIYVDPQGERIDGRRIRARVISFEEAVAKYGHSHVG